ncbi:hypothetical protein PP935_gp009 [Rhizobium phage RHph_N34]|uniref:Uncharacterized protein n=1 Tax=Rhizobium phage RHph_N34 TaxID=2509586 RepID=A0A7S5RJR2_9CAUD|nr:hypothetical protein PP935_gp009 [Rhizobium phage RHph_N34]QIG73784.1 hypothetical protein EVC06_009 [Rhizobium phage RHph_N34]
MALYVKQSGVWTPVPTLKTKNSGSWAQVQVGFVKVSGVWKQFYVPEVLVTITSNTLNVNLQSLFTSGVWSSSAVAKRVVINPGVIIGSSVPATAALRTGTGWGGTLTLENKGEIQGAGGVANSSAGGHAILCEAAGMIIRNTGAIRGGGGGGGKGGNGGAGYYYSTATEGPVYAYPGSPRYQWTSQNGTNINSAYWAGASIFGTKSNSNPYTLGAYTYYRGTQQAVDGCDSNGFYCIQHYSIYRQYQQTNNTSGGAGGNGGRGQGYGQTNASGSGGSAGGTNAGAGGTGGTGANFGAAGATGNSGANGNNGSGTAGTAGGAAGKAISGSSSLTNTGTIQGATS